MKIVAGTTVAWLSLFCMPLAWAASTEVTPIQKVLEMLSGMAKKAKEDKQAEKVEWAAFKEFCSNTELQKQTAIQKADVQAEALQADIEKHNAEVERLKGEIADHEADIKKYKADQEKATKDRKGERVTYEETHADYSESVTALTNAIGALKKRAFDIPQAASLLQLLRSKNHLPAAPKRALESFLSRNSKSLETASAPEADAYEFQSESIITMLEELKEKFIAERTDLEKAELVSRHEYDTVMMDLRNSIAHAENEIGKKSETKTENEGASTEASKLLGETKASRDDDQEYLTGLIGTCQQKQTDFGTRQQLRDEEIGAIEKAIEIIGGESVSGVADKHLPSMLQVRSSTSFVQFLSPSDDAGNQQKAIAFLSSRSQQLDSHILYALAQQMDKNPFKKVIKMIEDLISKLQAQALEEAEHKQWCDEELEQNGKTRKDKTEEVTKLHALIDELEARLAVLEKDLATLGKEIAEINAAVAKATKIRAEEKDTNEATIAEAVEGQTALAQAKSILAKYYEKAAGNTVLSQTSAEPPIFDTAFKGQQKQNSNVMAFLEVIASDFARLESDTRKAESTAQADYDDEMARQQKSKEAKEEEQKTKEKEQLTKSQSLATAQDDLEQAQKELDAALDYYDKLKPSCINAATPYDDRVNRRKEEIQSLQEAYKILNGEVVPDYGPDAMYSSVDGGNLAVGVDAERTYG